MLQALEDEDSPVPDTMKVTKEVMDFFKPHDSTREGAPKKLKVKTRIEAALESQPSKVRAPGIPSQLHVQDVRSRVLLQAQGQGPGRGRKRGVRKADQGAIACNKIKGPSLRKMSNGTAAHIRLQFEHGLIGLQVGIWECPTCQVANRGALGPDAEGVRRERPRAEGEGGVGMPVVRAEPQRPVSLALRGSRNA